MVERRAWVFDLDGTLTVPQHDFASLKSMLDLPPELGVLAGIATLPEARRADAHARVRAWEIEHIERSRVAPGALRLLRGLQADGAHLGILTRNTREAALRTLEVIDLTSFFAEADVLGRACAPPKPDPAGVLQLLGRWDVEPRQATLVGDFVHDLDAGRAAGVRTIWVDHLGDGRFSERADRTIVSLEALVAP